jgi:CopG-like RHH_1 or ribbon-helix-helix domain, RHH_5
MNAQPAHKRVTITLPADLLSRVEYDALAGDRPLSRQFAQLLREAYAQRAGRTLSEARPDGR